MLPNFSNLLRQEKSKEIYLSQNLDKDILGK